MNSRSVYLVGITGGSGSGKTTFAKKVKQRLGEDSVILHMDSYYLPTLPENLVTSSGTPNFDHPKAFDWSLLQHHLLSLKNGKDIESPIYDFATNSRTHESIKVKAAPIILFEGIFGLFKSEIRELLDVQCFLNVDSDIRFIRRLHRDVQERGRSLNSVIEQYYETVRPMYQKFLDPQKQFADFIVGEETDVASEILAARLEKFVQKCDIHEREEKSNIGPYKDLTETLEEVALH